MYKSKSDNQNKEYYLPVSANENAQFITIEKDIRINNEKIHNFLEMLLKKRKVINTLYILSGIFFIFFILSLIYFVHSYIGIFGAIVSGIIITFGFGGAIYLNNEWSADELHIIPIKEYEFKDDNSKILCTVSCYSFEEKNEETNLYPVSYIEYDLESNGIPYIDAYTYRASKKFWITIHLSEKEKS